jgi:hypothetical protein
MERLSKLYQSRIAERSVKDAGAGGTLLKTNRKVGWPLARPLYGKQKGATKMQGTEQQDGYLRVYLEDLPEALKEEVSQAVTRSAVPLMLILNSLGAAC